MQLLNAAKVVALIVRLPPTAPAGSKLAQAARAADVLGFGLPNPPKPPAPGPRLAPGGRLKPPGGRLKVPEGCAPGENEGTVTPCWARQAVYAANAAPFRPPGARLPEAALGVALGVALTAGLTAGVVDEVDAAFVLPLHAATDTATQAMPAVTAKIRVT